jgi:hypothetical protein
MPRAAEVSAIEYLRNGPGMEICVRWPRDRDEGLLLTLRPFDTSVVTLSSAMIGTPPFSLQLDSHGATRTCVATRTFHYKKIVFTLPQELPL